jgi:hypothetical protein
VPDGLPAAVVIFAQLGVLTLALYYGWTRRRSRQRQAEGLCTACGTNLRPERLSDGGRRIWGMCERCSRRTRAFHSLGYHLFLALGLVMVALVGVIIVLDLRDGHGFAFSWRDLHVLLALALPFVFALFIRRHSARDLDRRRNAVPPNKAMQLTKLRAAPVRRAEAPPRAPAGGMDGGTASQLVASVRRL